MSNTVLEVDVSKVDISIVLLKKYLKDTNIESLLSVLEDLKKEPNSVSILNKLKEELDKLGIYKGAVLSYAPYISILVSHDLFEDS